MKKESQDADEVPLESRPFFINQTEGAALR
jgi:hypothetical protein